jgi:hypothetical protein
MTDVYNTKRRNTFSMYQSALQKLLGQKNNIEEDYTRNVNSVETEKPNAYRKLLNSFAGRGMAHSSGYGYQQQETQNTFAKQISDMLLGKTRSLADIQGQESDAGQQYQFGLDEIASEETAQIAADQRAAAELAAQQQLMSQPEVSPTGQLSAAPVGAATPAAAKPAMNRQQYLRTHPVLASIVGNPAKLRAFLQQHPGIAREWSAY